LEEELNSDDFRDMETLWEGRDNDLLDLIGDYCGIEPTNSPQQTLSPAILVDQSTQTPPLQQQQTISDLVNGPGSNILNHEQRETLLSVCSAMSAQDLLELLGAYTCKNCCRPLIAYGSLARHLMERPDCLNEYGGFKNLPADLKEICDMVKRRAISKKAADTRKKTIDQTKI